MLKNGVYKLKADAFVAGSSDMPLKAGQEIEVVMDVVYINGNPVPPTMQSLFYNWLTNNPELFVNDTRTW